jgi:cytochrome b
MPGHLPVWGVGIRLLHWLWVSAIVVAWVTSSDVSKWHQVAGYIVATVLALRLGWGALCGPRSARLSRCLRALQHSPAYLRDMAMRRERRFLGHNPLGSLMVIVLLTVMLSVCFTGWLFTTDRFWGYAWLSMLHHVLAWVLVVLAGLHVTGVLITSLRHRENLVVAMLTGRKSRRVAK